MSEPTNRRVAIVVHASAKAVNVMCARVDDNVGATPLRRDGKLTWRHDELDFPLAYFVIGMNVSAIPRPKTRA